MVTDAKENQNDAIPEEQKFEEIEDIRCYRADLRGL